MTAAELRRMCLGFPGAVEEFPFGTVTSVVDDRVKVEIAPGVEVEVVRPAIGSVETVEDEGPGTASGTHPDDQV